MGTTVSSSQECLIRNSMYSNFLETLKDEKKSRNTVLEIEPRNWQSFLKQGKSKMAKRAMPNDHSDFYLKIYD